MAVIYGWTYAEFHARVGWDKGDATVYDAWENFWAYQADAYIYSDTGVHVTDANEKLELQTVINKMMVMMNLYLKAEHNETPMQSGFYGEGLPEFAGEPNDNNGVGSGDYIILNKLKRGKSQEFARADGIRVGVSPDNIYFSHDRFY